MFSELSLKELRLLLRELREHHSIKNYSKMKKKELIAAIEARFILRDGNLFLKQDSREPKAARPKTAAQLMAEYDGIEAKDKAAIKKELTADLKGFTGDPLTKFYPILMKYGYEI